MEHREYQKSDRGHLSTFQEDKQTGKIHKCGGKQPGAGKKRAHVSGYKQVKSLLWKNISLHTSIFNDWVKLKEDLGFKDHSHFAHYLLDTASSASPGSPHGQSETQAQRFVYLVI